VLILGYPPLHESIPDTWRRFNELVKTSRHFLVHPYPDPLVQPSQPSSYGQAAKVLDIAIKVYVYYCAQPTAEIAQRIVPFLNGVVDTAIMKELKKSKYAAAPIRATTIKEVDEQAYQALQAVVLAESCDRKMHPVQYDDIMWRQLNRDTNAPGQGMQPTAQELSGG